MHEGNLVICDQEQQYSRNLLQMFARNREAEVQMYLFHTMEEVEKFAEQKPVHTLLISREYPLGQRVKIPAEERFVLVESMQDSLAENETGVYRYQSADEIWSQMCHGSDPVEARKICESENPKVIGRKPGTENPETRERKQKSENPETRERRKRPENPETGERRQRQEAPEAGEKRQRQEAPETGKRRQGTENPEIRERRQEPEDSEAKERRQKSESPGIRERRQRPGNPEINERRQRRHRTPDSEIEERKQNVPVRCQTQTKGELIGIYSPVHRIGKTRFALELGRELARKEPVLYLNLEEYSGGSYHFPDETGQTLADLLYYARQEKGNLGLRISTMAGQDEELDYILPMPYVQDLQGVSGEEWLKLFEQILENCIYQKVILDLGDSINGLFEILEACHTVYTPYIEDEAARAKLNQYADNLRKTGKESVLEKTVQKKMKQKGGIVR